MDSKSMERETLTTYINRQDRSWLEQLDLNMQ